MAVVGSPSTSPIRCVARRMWCSGSTVAVDGACRTRSFVSNTFATAVDGGATRRRILFRPGCATEDARMGGRFSGQVRAARPRIVWDGDRRSRRRAVARWATAGDRRGGQGKVKEVAVVDGRGHWWSLESTTPSRSIVRCCDAVRSDWRSSGRRPRCQCGRSLGACGARDRLWRSTARAGHALLSAMRLRRPRTAGRRGDEFYFGQHKSRGSDSFRLDLGEVIVCRLISAYRLPAGECRVARRTVDLRRARTAVAIGRVSWAESEITASFILESRGRYGR